MKRLYRMSLVIWMMILVSGSASVNAESNPAPVSDGYYTIGCFLDDTKLLQVTEDSLEENQPLEIRSNGEISSVFYFELQSDGYYSILNTNSDKSLYAEEDTGTSGVELLQKTYDGSEGQKWIIKEQQDHSYKICSALGTDLEYQGGSTKDGTKVMLITPDSGSNQKWIFTKVTAEGKGLSLSMGSLVNDAGEWTPVIDYGDAGHSSLNQQDAVAIDQQQAAPPDTNPTSSQINETNPVPETAAQTEPPYIIPGCNTRYLSVEDLRQYDPGTLRLARNEIYARKGRWFNAADLQAYFDAQSWYHGYIDPDAFDRQEATILNPYEYSNARLILRYEKGEIY